MNKHKLPKGAKLLKVTATKKVGGYVPQVFDAVVKRHGIDWFRVKDGMGGHGDREDWVADVPYLCVSVHDYQWRPPYFGSIRFKNFDEAVINSMQNALRDAKWDAPKLRERLERAELAMAMLARSLASAKKGARTK